MKPHIFDGLDALIVACMLAPFVACVATQPAAFPAYCYDRETFIAMHVACSRAAKTREASAACGVELDRSCGKAP